MLTSLGGWGVVGVQSVCALGAGCGCVGCMFCWAWEIMEAARINMVAIANSVFMKKSVGPVANTMCRVWVCCDHEWLVGVCWREEVS